MVIKPNVRKIFPASTIPLPWPKLLVTRMLTRDLFAVANLLACYRATLSVSAVFTVGRVSVRLSICMSVCLSRSCIVSRRLNISSNVFLIPVAPSFWFILTSNASIQFQGEPLQRRCNIHGVGKLRFSTEIAVCRRNGTREAHGCYGTLIGSHRRRIDPCRFGWP